MRPSACLFALVSSLCWSAYAQSPPACEEMFRQSQFLQAARCFLTKANSMGNSKQLSKIQRYLKGQALRNAALSYSNAAKQEKNLEVAAYRREQALQILQRYLQENLCQQRYLCQLAKGESLELINQIQYIQLSVITSPDKRAIVEIQGYKFTIQHFSPPQWNERVRPGRYKIQVKYEGKPPIEKEVIAVPGKSITVTLLMPTPSVTVDRRLPPLVPDRPVLPPPAPGSGPVPWIIGGIGLAAALGGGALLIVSQLQVSERDRLLNQLKAEASSKTNAQERATIAKSNSTTSAKQQIDNAHTTATSTNLPGWILVGAGGAALATGIVLFFVLKPKPPASPAPTPTPSASPSKNQFLFSETYFSHDRKKELLLGKK